MVDLPRSRSHLAADLMTRFAERTGISRGQGARYLWTDAFAVCNFLGLEAATSDRRYGELAAVLVDRVHHQLGRFRSDDVRSGWLSGLQGDDAERHPTRGGLRIGKPLPERRPSEPFRPDAEWDRDEKYFHYLTKWAHALAQVARVREDSSFHAWARS